MPELPTTRVGVECRAAAVVAFCFQFCCSVVPMRRQADPATATRRRRLWPIAGLAVLAAALAFLLPPTEALAMSKMCLFSEVSGVVLDHGQPVAGATLERSWFWHWKDQKGGDSTQTDSQGAFRCPSVFGGSLLGSFLPHEPFVEQKILIQHGGKTYRAWVFEKGSYRENDELNGKPIRLVCRLEKDPVRKDNVFGICEWN